MDARNDVEHVISQLDDLGTSKTCFEIGSELTPVVLSLRDQENQEEADRIEHERQACLLTVSATIIRSYEAGKRQDAQTRFSGLAGFSDGSQWPDPNQFTPQTFIYLAERALATPNPVLKARYSDLVFEKSALADKYAFALAAIDAYLGCALGFSNSDHRSHQLEIISAMDQAATLALKIGHQEKLNQVVQTLLALIERQATPDKSARFGEGPQARLALDLSRIFLFVRGSRKYGKLVSDADVERVKVLALDLAELNAGDQFGRRAFLQIASAAAELLGQPGEEFSAELAQGESLVRQAEVSLQQSGNGPRHLIAASVYEDAVQHFQRMRNQERFTEILTPDQRADLLARENALKLKIREMYRLGRNEFSRFEVPIDIPKDAVEQMLEKLLAPDTLAECLEGIVRERSLLPDLESAEEAALEAQDQGPLLHVFPMRSIQNDITVSIAETEPQKLSQQVHSSILLWLQINSSVILDPLMARLQEQKGLNAETYTDYLRASGLFEEDRLVLIQIGMERFFSGDYVSALHILVPQFEDALRTLFERGGQGMIQPRRDAAGWQMETFGQFLSHDFVKKTLPTDMRTYIQLVMTDQTGWNLRNRIAHGFVRPQDCNIVTAVTVVHLFLLLTIFRLEERNKDESCQF